jgi:hypothetical protein
MERTDGVPDSYRAGEMTLNDGMGTYLRIWSDGIWVYIGASLRIRTMLLGWLAYLLVGWSVYRWRRSRRDR